MSEEKEVKEGSEGSCAAIEHVRVQAQIESERDERRFKHRLITLITTVMAVCGVIVLSGSMYGWLFLEKEFLDGPLENFFDGITEAIRILIG